MAGISARYPTVKCGAAQRGSAARRFALGTTAVLFPLIAGLGATSPASAQSPTDAQIKALQA
jgi:hypothetical protein